MDVTTNHSALFELQLARIESAYAKPNRTKKRSVSHFVLSQRPRSVLSAFLSDGKRIVFLTDITGLPQRWQVGLPIEPDAVLWHDQLTFEADRVLGVWASPVRDDARLIYARDVGGNENMQLYLLSVDNAGHVVVPTLTMGFDKVMHLFGAWSWDGKQILFAANRRDPSPRLTR